MYRLCFVLTLCIYGVLGEWKGFNDWQYDNGRPSTNQAGNSKCKKDLLLIVDTSYSVGEGDFKDNVKPFLKNLVTDSRLNVGPDGTQVGLILFSSVQRTMIKLNIGDKKNAQDLEQYFESLSWNVVSGSRTRTELALQLANRNVFPKNNPLNHRQDIADVVVLITDGEPRGKRNTLALTKQYAQALKDKKVLLVTAAVGPMSEKAEFENLLKELATSEDYFLKAKFDNMDQILGTLVAKSCVVPGKCSCNEIIPDTVYIKPGKSNARVDWIQPDFTCATGGEVTVESTTVQPSLKSPQVFSAGKYVINYTYNLKGGVIVTCPVTITVKGELCRGVAFNSARQVCCCGTIYSKRSGFECCGPDYYNTSIKQCCKDANLVPRKDSCPNI